MNRIDYGYRSESSLFRPFHVAYQHIRRAFAPESSATQRISDVTWALFESIPGFNYFVVSIDRQRNERTIYDHVLARYGFIWDESPQFQGDPIHPMTTYGLRASHLILGQMTAPFMKAHDSQGNPMLLSKSDPWESDEGETSQEFVAISDNHVFTITHITIHRPNEPPLFTSTDLRAAEWGCTNWMGPEYLQYHLKDIASSKFAETLEEMHKTRLLNILQPIFDERFPQGIPEMIYSILHSQVQPVAAPDRNDP